MAKKNKYNGISGKSPIAKSSGSNLQGKTRKEAQREADYLVARGYVKNGPFTKVDRKRGTKNDKQ